MLEELPNYESKSEELDLGRLNQEKEPSFDLYLYMYIQYKQGLDIDTNHLIILCSTILQWISLHLSFSSVLI